MNGIVLAVFQIFEEFDFGGPNLPCLLLSHEKQSSLVCITAHAQAMPCCWTCVSHTCGWSV